MNLRILALPTTTAQRVRTTMKSPGYSHPASIAVATGHGPCRHCLQPFRIQEDHRILFTCDPFYQVAEIPAPGPVFIHAEPCERYSEDAGYPPQLLAYPAVMDAYDVHQTLLAQRRVTDHSHPTVLKELLTDEAVSYVIVRDLKAGCYDFRVERM